MLLCYVSSFIFLHCPLSGPVLTSISLLIIPCMIVYVTNKQEPWTLNLEPFNSTFILGNMLVPKSMERNVSCIIYFCASLPMKSISDGRLRFARNTYKQVHATFYSIRFSVVFRRVEVLGFDLSRVFAGLCRSVEAQRLSVSHQLSFRASGGFSTQTIIYTLLIRLEWITQGTNGKLWSFLLIFSSEPIIASHAENNTVDCKLCWL